MSYRKKLVFCLLSIISTFFISSCADESGSQRLRDKQRLTDWQFCEDTSPIGSEITLPEGSEWSNVTVPHVFRQSGLPDESAGWYRKEITLDPADKGQCFYLFLEGAASAKDIYVNGKHMGAHRGAFTAAVFDLTEALTFGKPNTLLVRVSHRPKEADDCLSKSCLFYTNGGMYRPAWLIKTAAVHIYPDMASTGVYLTGKDITAEKATLEVKTFLKNSQSMPVKVTVQHVVTDPTGAECGQMTAEAEVAVGAVVPVTAVTEVQRPKLWDIARPNLYTVSTDVMVDGKVVDTLTERTGFRTIAMKDDNFMLNGKKLLARGVCKHHQNEHQWNAMSDEQLAEEWDWMVDLGVNTVRLAHYPHRRLEYNMADENGIAVWAETGLAGQRWEKSKKMRQSEQTPTADGERITREMVRQNWNHPSIIFWSSGNETNHDVASRYADVIRQEDTTRLVTYASAGEIPTDVDFVAGNTYQGWYYDHYTDFAQVPKNAFVSETGSGSWITQHVPQGIQKWVVDHFEPQEYTELFAEYRFQTIFRNNPDAHKMFLWWNMREFYDWKFKKNRNTKGMVTLGGMPKDYYYLYKSFLRPDEPVLHLCGRHFFYRQFEPDNGIKVYSNANEVELLINGVSQGKKANGEYIQPNPEHKGPDEKIGIDNVFFWTSSLNPGRNLIEARDDRGDTAFMVIYQKGENGVPAPSDSLVVDLKSSNENNPAIFIDRAVESQGSFYTEVDGSSDNTFDVLPDVVEGAAWIATKRMSDGNNKTDLSFKVTQPATIYVMYSTGTFPTIVLRGANETIAEQAAALTADLEKNGFNDTGVKGTWRGHDLWLADYGLCSRDCNPGETVTVPGHVLDYVVLIKAD